jgi:hypothetical protein
MILLADETARPPSGLSQHWQYDPTFLLLWDGEDDRIPVRVGNSRNWYLTLAACIMLFEVSTEPTEVRVNSSERCVHVTCRICIISLWPQRLTAQSHSSAPMTCLSLRDAPGTLDT